MKKSRNNIIFLLIIGIGLILLLISTIIFTNMLTQGGIAGGEFSGTIGDALWRERGIDVLIQIIIIFAGVLGILALRPEEEKK